MQRLDHTAASPEGYKKLLAVSAFLGHSGLEANLRELISIRASQINGCAWCLDFHIKRARHQGETERRICLLSGWRDAPVYSPRERAALEWTETLALIAGHTVPDDLYQRAREQFSEAELANLTIAVGLINVWNRINVAFHTDLSSVPQFAPEPAAAGSN
jgi:AhpD family alkylhydroperoxidase